MEHRELLAESLDLTSRDPPHFEFKNCKHEAYDPATPGLLV